MITRVLPVTKERMQRRSYRPSIVERPFGPELGCKRFALFFILAHLHSSGSAGKPKGGPPDRIPPQVRLFGSTNPAGSPLAKF